MFNFQCSNGCRGVRMVARLAGVAVLAGLLVTVGGWAQGFEVSEVLSAPFPSGLVAAPAGGAVAWVMNEGGARNVWVAGPPEYRGRRVTSWTEDDAMEVSQLAFTPDGSRIVFVRGHGANRQGEFPNPRHQLQPAERSVWIVGTGADGEARRLAAGSSPLPTPDGEAVLYLDKGDLWRVGLAADSEPERLTKLRGSVSSLRWSPDGSRLTFVSGRGDHSFIGVMRPGEERVRFLDPSLDRDSDPVFSPDGGKIAFLRFPARRGVRIFEPARSAQPWSIRVFDLESGESRTVFQAEEGPGSAYWSILADNELFWSSDGHLVFAWEKNGWNQLYSIPAEGGEARHLTPGNFEVEYAALSRDGTEIVYNSNQGDPHRRHLWRVAARGGPALPLTDGSGIEWAPTPASDPDVIAFFRSSARQPARPAALVHGREVLLAPDAVPSAFPAAQLVEPEAVVFRAADGMPIPGQLFRPAGGAGRRHPAVLYFHGGSRRQMLLGFHYSNYYHNAYAMNQYLASRGFVVLSVNYRSGIGYGMEFREALNYGASGASEFNDVLGAGLYLQGLQDVDPERIGLWGGSYGGYLTALGLARASNLFAAGVDLHGVHDWNPVIRNFIPSYDPLEDPERARLAFESSPLASVDTWRSPVLLIHGDDDRNVPFSESVHLAEALREQGVEFEQLVFPDEVHGFLLHETWVRTFEAAADFLGRKLAPRR